MVEKEEKNTQYKILVRIAQGIEESFIASNDAKLQKFFKDFVPALEGNFTSMSIFPEKAKML